ncbi:MBL fold metallo-hydrolase [Natronocalculus amylovorans]|uniref:MBL fold metallo-hydrolase n=1 Tax=Natronocalculus amylovorans TaxID=2917812 RepID=A0AAE3FYZ6_9EURY|nr:MBL fold metallo-hydrolase [Natronocalculus amylovorans]MCL9817899.1 MBL fold metallo-hydrolase [Natronocalculus amylovorans]
MEVTFLGTGAAMPIADRVQTGLLVSNADRHLLLDCGSGILHRLSQTSVGYEAIDTVLLTHHHLDHISDLLVLLKARWLAGETALEIVGPPGTESMLEQLLSVHSYLQGRVDLSIREIAADERVTICGFGVDAIETVHSMDGYSYRIAPESDGEPVFGYSGDTEAQSSIAQFFAGCRVVAHDCSFPDSIDVSNHPTPTQLGEAFTDADVDRLYLTHLYPHTEGKHDEMCQAVSNGFAGEVRIARDGLRIEI